MAEPLSIDEARARVLATARPLPAQDVALAEALGRVLSEDVLAAGDVPPFAGSAMDGFAVRSGPSRRALRIVGESRAGMPAQAAVGEGEAVRISTGAAMPEGADAVLQLELAEDRGDSVLLQDEVEPGRNVRRAGEDLRAGEVALRAGTRLGPAEVGVAASAGRAEVRCARRPRVAVLATGDELAEPGAPLGPGQIHDSNLLTLSALATRAGAEVAFSEHVRDDAGATRDAVARALETADVLICSGGVSVGPHDHVKDALAASGVEEVFWRVALRPGGPTWFGARGERLVFGLPGNPVSAMVTFALFARPALHALEGDAQAAPARSRARLADRAQRRRERDECLRVRVDDEGWAHLTGPQGSHQLTSMLAADALAIVPRGEGALERGAEVEIERI
ncbi:MAG TPA: gephyrin-like molybdotransferase Glp [Solirubrobacteraceae bacterium]|nr:gephyrin-like molybdotransferase Glp [Solirubrobacteraceae bacterium]